MSKRKGRGRPLIDPAEGRQETFNLRLPSKVKAYYKANPGMAKNMLIEAYKIAKRLEPILEHHCKLKSQLPPYPGNTNER